MSNTYSVSDKTLRLLITELYSKAGMPEDEAAYHADGLVTASLRGVDSHGVLRTSAYLSRLQNGAINVRIESHPL